MDYEKAYKEALKRAKILYNDKNEIGYANAESVLEEVFPLLKESEDEKVREYLIRYIDNTMKDSELKSKLLAWLEKQKNCEYIRKDWLEHIKQSWYKEGFIDGKYTHKELTINDVTTLNELIDFLENGTAKLQHDLTLYANWLKTQFPPNEKQGEQKPTLRERYKNIAESEWFKKTHEGMSVSDDEKVDNVNKIETKFKVGDWITNGDYTWKIVEVKPLDYILQSQDGNIVDDTISYIDEEFNLWTIQDAKDGDVLATEDNCICIFDNTVEEGKYPFAYCGLSMYGFKVYDRTLPFTHDNVYPATKEQRDLLFQKMKEAGYEWDAEKKELRKIEQENAWSEEDEKRIKDIIYFLDTAKKHYASTVELDACINWLKSLKERIGGE